MKEWFVDCLGCVVGRNEYLKGRYVLNVVRSPADVMALHRKFVAHVETYSALGCLFIFNVPDLYSEAHTSTAEAMAYLASMMACVTGADPTQILNGGALHTAITVRCPVTDKLVTFEDFDGIAFCPQAASELDPLYDPLMAAPHACVNISSDIFGFAVFVRDLSIRQFGFPPFRLSDRQDRARLFGHAGTYWQRFAEGSIRRYQQVTNTALCPVHLTPDRRHWVANHKDPAFAELEKNAHLHDMPAIYTTAMMETWEQYLEHGTDFDMSALGNDGRLM